MYSALKHSHSGLRYIVLILLIAAIVVAYRGWKRGNGFNEGDRKLAMFAMISVHIQFLIGIILYYLSPLVKFSGNVMGEKITRFYTVEHIMMMVIAMILITVGHAKSKRIVDAAKKYKTIFVYYLIAFLFIINNIMTRKSIKWRKSSSYFMLTLRATLKKF